MTMTGFIDYTKPVHDRQRTTSNLEPLPITNVGGPNSQAGAVWGPDQQGSMLTRPSLQSGLVFNSPLPTVLSGQKVDWQGTANGEGRVAISLNSISAVVSVANTDNTSFNNGGLFVNNRNYLASPNSNWDRVRNVLYANNTQGQGVQASSDALWSTSDMLANVVNFSAVGDNTLISGVAAQTIRIHRLYIVAAGATVIIVKDGAGTALTGPMPLAANGSITLDFSGRPWYKTSAGNGFIINSSAAVQIGGRVEYAQST